MIDRGHVLASGRVQDLKESEETLEDVFIRLVGTSFEEIEAMDGSEEE